MPAKTMTGNAKRVAVLGGGITGLAAAHRLRELDPTCDVTLFEASSRLGGVLKTVRRDGYLVEHSADNFITSVPWGLDLCRRLGFEHQLLSTNPGRRGALVVHRGRLEPVPAGFMLMAPSQIWPIVTTRILSPWGKLRLASECLVPRRTSDEDESLAAFARRRLGRETFERIVQPLVGGIYTADPEKLSLASTLPRFIEMERSHGSLIRAALAGRGQQPNGTAQPSGSPLQAGSRSGARYELFVAPRDGMSSLIQALADRLPSNCVQLNAPVQRIEPAADGQWSVQLGETRSGDAVNGRPWHGDAVILATPAPVTARLVRGFDPALADELGQIEYAGTAIVCVAVAEAQIGRPLDSFGFVVPAVERRLILAGSFSSVKFVGRAPDGKVLLRVFIGGACQAELLQKSDEALQAIALDELRSLIQLQGQPQWMEVVRWPQAMPQYHVGHCQRVRQIVAAAARWPHLALAGNAYEGVGVPNCIHSGETAAAQVLNLPNEQPAGLQHSEA